MPRRKEHDTNEEECRERKNEGGRPWGNSTGRAVLSLYCNEKLNDDGTPNPLLVGRNKLELGYTCPEREYIEAVIPPSMAYLARKWGVTIDTLESWSEGQDWPSRRSREWMKVEKMAFDSSKERLAEIRNMEQAKQREGLMMMRTLLDEKIKDGKVIESTSTGQIYERPLSIKEMKEATAAYVMINEGINSSLGIQKNLGKLDDSAVEGGTKITRKVVHKHVQTTTETTLELHEPQELPALPEGGITYEVCPETNKEPVLRN